MGNQELIIEVIKRYIKSRQSLNSAIMIKGKWGCGKTYFVKKILGQEIKDFLKTEDKRLYYITLNGLSNAKELIDRIQSIIVREAYGYLKNTKDEPEIIEIITGIDSICDEIKLQGWLNVARGVKKKIDNVISKNNIRSSVFIFDDLERCTISLKEVLGFINDLVEHELCKCIIIANEEEITNNEDFIKIKEKFISRTIEFIPNIEAFLASEWQSYRNLPLSNLSNENWKKFIDRNIYQYNLNLRTVQSSLYIANEVYSICIDRLLKNDFFLRQKVLYKLLADIYSIENYYKNGNSKPNSEDESEILGIYKLGDNLNTYLHTFKFIIDIVYDGIYNEEIILNQITYYIDSINMEGKLSPIIELKNFYFMEDDDIQEKLDLIHSNINKLNLNQISDFFNSLIPLLDLGFTYNQLTDFNQVLDLILEKIEINTIKSDYSYELLKCHTILEGEQAEKYTSAMEMVKKVLEDKEKIDNEYINKLLNDVNWTDKLKSDLKQNEYYYRKEKKYLSYFNLEDLLDKIKNSSNKQIVEFRDILYALYRRNYCKDSFTYDDETARSLINMLKSIEVNKKINKLTINYIINDLEESFPKD
ncbi:P-loop NTPase fold protein [Thomasclavelia sp.]|uniref:P-loop NTPase fold protein n=1 Tax=Thomasclavelia sp. TaxID=3025757 RepID=UPI002600746B|nr:P-loop NTPase fold protein [Thomasclavelia sp.]